MRKDVDLTISAPHLLTMAGDGVGYLADSAVVVDDGRILAVTTTEDAEATFAAAERLHLDQHVVLPGFIDAHMHTALDVMRGLAQDTNNWMMYGLQPFENATRQAEKDAGSRIGYVEGIMAGTTTFGDFEIDMEGVCRFIEKAGVRGHIAQVIRSARRRVYNPGELYELDDEMGRESLTRTLDLFDRWHGQADGRIRINLGPQGVDFVSLDLLREVHALAKERRTLIHMHTQQGDRETYQIVTRYGKRPTELLDEMGILDSSLMAVHLTDCTDEEAALIARRGAGMLLCPGSIAIIDGIVPPSAAFQDAGGSVALGSDQAPGNNCHNIFNEMKNVALFNKIKYANPEVMPAWRALRMATIEGARATGLADEIGSLEEGKAADLIAVNLRTPTMQPVFTTPMRNIVPNLVYSARGDEVTHSIVNGRVVMRDRVIETLEVDEILDAVADYPAGIGERATPEFEAIDGTNAQFMRAGQL